MYRGMWKWRLVDRYVFLATPYRRCKGTLDIILLGCDWLPWWSIPNVVPAT
jgi:hypothetical protein